MGFGALAYDPTAGLLVPDALPDVGAPLIPSGPQWRGTRLGNRLLGTGGEERFQTWPEKLVRSAVTLPGDVLSGEQPILPPGLRREDYTDAPPPAPGSAEGIFGNTLFAPVQAQPNDPAYERAQDLAGMAGGGMMFGRLGAEATLGSGPVMRRHSMIDNADQLRELANQRRARGEATGKSNRAGISSGQTRPKAHGRIPSRAPRRDGKPTRRARSPVSRTWCRQKTRAPI